MGRPIVIKYGGSLLEDAVHRARFLKEIAALSHQEKIVLVHGGGKEITRAVESAGLPTRFVQGRRYTDEKTLAIVERVLAKINADLVATLRAEGADAAGFSGKTDQVLVARPLPDLGRVGQPQVVDQQILEALLARAELPVFYSIATDSHRKPLNMNADDFALAIAVAAQAKRLVFLTDSGGILNRDGQTIELIGAADVDDLIASETITGGMIVKVQACMEAVRRGVSRVDICKGIQSLLDPNVKINGTSFLKNPDHRN